MGNWAHYSLVEGDFKNFRIRRIVLEDHDKVCEHIAECFLKGEPTSQLLGYSDKFAEEVNVVIRKVLPQGLSFLAEDKETGEIAAVRISFHHTKDIAFDEVKTSRQAQLLFKLLDEIEEAAEIHSRYGVESWAEFLIASTNPKYRSNGIAGEFYTRSIEFFKAEGFKHAVVVVTNAHTKAATKKRGFEEASRIDYDKFLDFEGNPAFDKNQLTPEHFALCVVKKIQ